MTAVVDAERLTKFYGGTRGIEDVSFSVEPGEIFGFLGPNGAGKTTTIRLLLDLIRPTSGRVSVLGADPRRGAGPRRRIGYLPGDLSLYERLAGRELLGFFAHIRRLGSLEPALELARRFDLELDRPTGALSRGNRQKIGIVQAFMHEPDLLVLDEPTSGLDPLVQQTFYELLRETRARGATVFLSSHVLPEVQVLADRVAVLREGQLLLVEAVESLRARALSRVEATFVRPPAPDAFARVPGVRQVGAYGSTVLFAVDGSPDALVKALAAHRILALSSHEADLEDVFLSLYRGDGRAP